MGISPSPEQVRRELANLDDKESDRRKSAMEVLKSHVKVLDSQAIPLFLSQVSSTTKLETASLSAVLRISLCEFVVRVHRLKIAPFIDTIMTAIINSLALASSAAEGSFLLQLACFKVVLAITRAVVDSDHWRIASDDMVMMVCRHVEEGLDRYPNQTNAYMSLIMALAKHNALVVENYVWDFADSGLRILNDGVVEENCLKQLWAIRMIYFLMKCVSWRYYLKLQLIIEEMELRRFDRMDYVREAAFEAWYMAKRRAVTEFKKGRFGSVTKRSNFSLREHSWRRQRIPRNGISRSNTTSPPRSRFPINVDSNILRKTPRMLVRSLSLNASLDVDGDDELVSSTNDLPGDSTNDLPGHSNVRVCSPKRSRFPINVDSNILRETPRMVVRSLSLNGSLDVDGDDELVSSRNDLPGVSTYDLPGNDLPGVSTEDLPGDSANDLPGVSTDDLPGDSTNDLPGVSTDDLRGDSDEQVYSLKVVNEGRTKSFRSSIGFLLLYAVFIVVSVALAIWFRSRSQQMSFSMYVWIQSSHLVVGLDVKCTEIK
ncbi:hypothetical protein FNV43_RR12795 [Rhamnella rubrinervis]|uniref:Uncharacterized protein n=1 Tax=Rhamnella rubrinervis TaxID=2594499 RepID=A0A8K0MJ50_9ROSA|nr:hypothetical protein FNV43_RR12795 [Rhamnella rubrinervis]